MSELIKSTELNEKYGINYNRLQYLVRSKGIKVVEYVGTSSGFGKVGLYELEKVLEANSTINPNEVTRHRYKELYDEKHVARSTLLTSLPDYMERDGVKYALNSALIRDHGLNKWRLAYIRYHNNIQAIDINGKPKTKGYGCYHDFDLIMRLYSVRKVAEYNRGNPSTSSRPRKTALDYRNDGRKLAWIARRLNVEIYDVMKELGIA